MVWEKTCAEPGCGNLVARGRARCHEHTRRQGRAAEYDSIWRKFGRWWRDGGGLDPESETFIRDLDLRQRCAACGSRTRALDLDHIIALADGGARLDPANIQPLCRICHARKTAGDVASRDASMILGYPQK